MNEWPMVRLDRVATIFNGKTPSRAEQRDDGHPVLKIKDVSEGRFSNFESFVDENVARRYSSKFLQIGDSLILNAAHSATHVASKTYFAEPAAVGALITGEWLTIRPQQDLIDGEYLNCWINMPSTRQVFRNLIKGIHLYPRDVSRLLLPLPDVAEQRAIAKILGQAGAVRAKRQAAIILLDQLAQSIFREKFGDPVANDRGWPLVKVADFIQGFESGKSIAEASEGSNYRILKVSAVTLGIFDPLESKPVSLSYSPLRSHIVRDGDLLFSRANTSELVGATAFVSDPPENLLLPDKLWRFVWQSPNRVDPVFVHYLFQQPEFRGIVSQRATGTSGSMKNISQATKEKLSFRTSAGP